MLEISQLGCPPVNTMRLRMPLPSSFETLIADLFEKTDPPDEAPRPSHLFSINSLEAAWEVAANARVMPNKTAGNGDARHPHYAEEGSEGAAHGVLLDPYRIMSELGLHSSATEAEVVVLRREFALRNHPDRVPAELRDVATQRMMIANDLIDRHVAKLRNSGN
jgi:hypothetical protein